MSESSRMGMLESRTTDCRGIGVSARLRSASQPTSRHLTPEYFIRLHVRASTASISSTLDLTMPSLGADSPKADSLRTAGDQKGLAEPRGSSGVPRSSVDVDLVGVSSKGPKLPLGMRPSSNPPLTIKSEAALPDVSMPCLSPSRSLCVTTFLPRSAASPSSSPCRTPRAPRPPRSCVRSPSSLDLSNEPTPSSVN